MNTQNDQSFCQLPHRHRIPMKHSYAALHDRCEIQSRHKHWLSRLRPWRQAILHHECAAVAKHILRKTNAKVAGHCVQIHCLSCFNHGNWLSFGLLLITMGRWVQYLMAVNMAEQQEKTDVRDYRWHAFITWMMKSSKCGQRSLPSMKLPDR